MEMILGETKITSSEQEVRVSRRFKLSRVSVTDGNYSKCMTEVQGELLWVQVTECSSYWESTILQLEFQRHEVALDLEFPLATCLF